ncbi:unnamed protein product [Sphagnum troendelagicum]|uniref:AIG1-type G domain-containing protein n=1 Tax=Sphagnum troendelagicum TaxID=128251 RepID=A0ABP0U635_9BRYO
MANCKTKILLFGRTGSGKSTVANMLIKGNLDSPLLFEISSGIRGKTRSFQREENDEYMVVDTVGFGEVERGTVSDVEARNQLYDFFTKINETGYNYFAFVCKWGKIDELDTHLWNFFKKAFEGVEQNFVHLFTHCKHSTLQENLEEVKARFEGCSKFIAVDFPPRSKQKGSNPGRVRLNEKMRARSLEHLQNELKKSMCPSSTPSLHSTMNKGRLLLLGRCASARNMIAKLLVNGTFEHNSISGKEESQQGGASTSSSSWSGVPVDEETPYEELEGRGWQVVNVTAFGSLVKAEVPYTRTLVEGQVGVTRWIPWQIEQAMSHGSYSHIIYIGEIGDVSEPEKLVHTVITRMLGAMRDYLVAIIVETSAQSTEIWNMPQDVNGRFKSWKTLLCMQFPNVSNQPDVERENIVVRQKSLHLLEETLGGLTLPRFLSKFSPSMNQGSKFLNEMQITLTWSHFDQLWNFHNRFYTTYDPFKLTNIEVLDLIKMSDLPFASEVFNYPPFVKLKSKVIFLKLKWELSSPQKILLVVDCCGAHDAIAQNWTWGELQVVCKNNCRLSLNTGQWKDLEYTSETRDTDGQLYMRFRTDVTRSNEDVQNHIFLDNIRKDDTLILWLCPPPLESQFSFSWCGARMRVEA